MSPQDHSNLLYIVGFLVVTGFGSIVTAIGFTIKQIVSYSRLEFRVELLEKDINAQFTKLRATEKQIEDIQEIKGILEALAAELNRKRSD